MRIGLLSDTHGFLDDAIFTHFADCDEIWHAGDAGNEELLTRIESFKPLRAVYGNIDGPEVRARAPLDLEWTCGGARVYMTHIDDARARKQMAAKKPDVFVCGHSHILKIAPGPPLYLNPGACGHEGWHRVRTVLCFSLNGCRVSEVVATELGPRGRRRTADRS